MLLVDLTPPLITLTGDAAVTVEQGQDYTEQGARASDAVDGDSAATVGGDTVDTSVTVGTVFSVTYDATDAAQNPAAQVTQTVTITCGKYRYLLLPKLVALIFRHIFLFFVFYL